MSAQDDEHLYSLPYERLPADPNNYNDLINKPKLNGHIIEGDKTASEYDINVPTKVSDLTNDANYATESEIPTQLSQLANNVGFTTQAYVDDKIDRVTNAIPTKTSQLTNDSGFITSASLPTKTSELTNDSGFITSSSLPTKTSDLTNDSGFVTQANIDNSIAQISIPTKTSQLTNDSGFALINQIPTQTSQLTNNSGYVTQSDVNTAIAQAGIPTKTSQLTNDSGFLVQADINSQFAYEKIILNANDMTLPTGVSLYGDNFIERIGKLIIAHINIQIISATKQQFNILNYISNPLYRPKENGAYSGGDGDVDGIAQGFTLNSTGTLVIWNTKTGTTYCQGTAVYFCN